MAVLLWLQRMKCSTKHKDLIIFVFYSVRVIISYIALVLPMTLTRMDSEFIR